MYAATAASAMPTVTSVITPSQRTNLIKDSIHNRQFEIRNATSQGWMSPFRTA